MTDTALQLRAAADLIRIRAKTAAHVDADGDDELCCWDTERLGGHERVIEIRTFADGTTDHGIIAVPPSAGVAGHIALWDPTNVVAVADLLEAIAEPTAKVPDVVYWRALTLAKLLDESRDHEDEK